MRIHDIGPRTEVVYPAAHGTSRDGDYGTRGFVERERPYIDDEPAPRHGWEAGSRWGTRPAREIEREIERGGTTARHLFHRAWARIRRAGRDG